MEREQQEREGHRIFRTPITPAANTTSEPPMTGMLIQSDDDEAVPADPTEWLYSVTRREPSREALLIDSAAAT